MTLRLGVRLTVDDGVDALRKAIRQVLGQGRAEIVLDLGQVTHIDSSGLAELLFSRTALEKGGRRLSLARVSKPVEDVLRITRLDRLFAA
jgi:anti-sigma B factor antagonist